MQNPRKSEFFKFYKVLIIDTNYYGFVAQYALFRKKRIRKSMSNLVERLPLKQDVASSNLVGPTFYLPYKNQPITTSPMFTAPNILVIIIGKLPISIP